MTTIKAGSIDETLDWIYDTVDDLMLAERFDDLNVRIMSLDTRNMCIEVMLGWLTATRPGKYKLSARRTFFEKARKTLVDRGEYRESLFVGLE